MIRSRICGLAGVYGFFSVGLGNHVYYIHIPCTPVYAQSVGFTMHHVATSPLKFPNNKAPNQSRSDVPGCQRFAASYWLIVDNKIPAVSTPPPSLPPSLQCTTQIDIWLGQWGGRSDAGRAAIGAERALAGRGVRS